MERLPVTENLRHRGIIVQSSNCQLCGIHVESTNHVLVDYDFSKNVYYLIFKWCGLQNIQFKTLQEFIDFADS